MDPAIEAERLQREIIAATLAARADELGGSVHRQELADAVRAG